MTELTMENVGEFLDKGAVDFNKIIELMENDDNLFQTVKRAMEKYLNSKMSIIKKKRLKNAKDFEKETEDMLKCSKALVNAFEGINSTEKVMEYATLRNDEATELEFARSFIENWNKTVLDYNYSFDKFFIDYED